MLALSVGMVGVSPGCSSIDEIYYISTESPDEGVSIYYRVRLHGRSTGGKTKYSAGFYDRKAVERLFAENSIEREHLSTKVDVFDATTGLRLTELAAEIERAEKASMRRKWARTHEALASASGLLGTYTTKLSADPHNEGLYGASLGTARKLLEDASAALKPVDSADVNSAIAKVRQAQGILETIRVAVDGRVLVRHFDGAGNEIDTEQKTLVVFVANDVSRFAEAIRQLADSEETTQQVVDIVLSRRINEAKGLTLELARTETSRDAKLDYIDETLKELPEDQASLKAAISSIAQVVSEKVGSFGTSEEIRAYAEGME